GISFGYQGLARALRTTHLDMLAGIAEGPRYWGHPTEEGGDILRLAMNHGLHAALRLASVGYLRKSRPSTIPQDHGVRKTRRMQWTGRMAPGVGPGSTSPIATRAGPGKSMGSARNHASPT